MAAGVCTAIPLYTRTFHRQDSGSTRRYIFAKVALLNGRKHSLGALRHWKVYAYLRAPFLIRCTLMGLFLQKAVNFPQLSYCPA